MLRTRLLSAAVGIPLVVLTSGWAVRLLAAVVALAVAIASHRARDRRAESHARRWRRWRRCVTAPLPLAALAGERVPARRVVAASVLILAALHAEQRPARRPRRLALGRGAGALLRRAGGHFVLLRQRCDWTARLVFFTLITVWVTDTGAYFVGRAIGRHKLAPAISPGKTIEGAFGSLVAGFAAVFVLNEALGLGLAVEHRVALGCAAAGDHGRRPGGVGAQARARYQRLQRPGARPRRHRRPAR